MSTSSSSKNLAVAPFRSKQNNFDVSDQLAGVIKYKANGVRVIRDLTEIHEAEWFRLNAPAMTVCVKYLRYATVIENDIHLSTEEKAANRTRILVQMKRWTSLHHANILPFFGYQWIDVPLLVFSWYSNGNITQYLKSNPSVNRLKLLIDVAAGLSYLHSLQPEPIVHGSIKPSNVIISDKGVAALMDFGMAPDLRTVERNLTMADSGRDTIGYLSSEVIEEGMYSAASDVYAFGSLMLEVMSGHPPFYSLGYVPTMIQISNKAKPSKKEHEALPANSPLWDVMESCWDAKPSERPSIQNVCETLKSLNEVRKPGWLRCLLTAAFQLLGIR